MQAEATGALARLTAAARSHADALTKHPGAAFAHALHLGDAVLEAGNILPKGADWNRWVKDEVKISPSLARQCRRLSAAFPSPELRDRSKNISIVLGAANRLASPKVPQELRDRTMQRALAGEHIDLRKAKSLIADAHLPVPAPRPRRRSTGHHPDDKSSTNIPEVGGQDKDADIQKVIHAVLPPLHALKRVLRG